MATNYFKVVATDGCKTFEPVGQWNGMWFGVAKVVDEAEIKRLTERGCRELTEAQYEAEVKKKAMQQSSLDDYRQVLATPVVPPVANPQAGSSSSVIPAEPPKVEQVIKPAPIPARRKSVVT